MIIAVDFDGTLCKDAYPQIGEPMPGAIKSMQQLKKDGHYLILWTCRTGERLKEAINWLLEHNIPIDRINDHSAANIALYGEGGNKIYADVYIDDKALGGFPGWFMAMDMIRDMQSTQ